MIRRTTPVLSIGFAVLVGAAGSNAMPFDAHAPLPEPLAESVLGVGACAACHDQSDRPTRTNRSQDDGCTPCHESPSNRGIFPGRAAFEISSHSLDTRMQWPGPPRAVSLAQESTGTCVQCHDPHGRRDDHGRVGSLLLDRDPSICLRCHDGRVSEHDVAVELRKPYSHGARQSSGRHDAAEPATGSSFSYGSGRRHVGCADCHNPHLSTRSSGNTVAPEASVANAGVSRIRVSNGPAGTQPRYQWLSPADGSRAVLEYEICFKCHSSWTQLPPGEPDLARLLNPANRSHHAVESAGNNPRVDPNSFVGDWNPSSVVLCSDCHGSDDPYARGPHGSANIGMLRRPYVQAEANDPDLLCYQCHNYETYGTANGFALGASRFNPPRAVAGHARHVGTEGIHCSSCHQSHGSFELPALLVDRRGVQLLRVTETPEGGSCQSGCHGPREYRWNYPW